MLGHNRPPYEILKPNIQDHEKTFEKEFFGMTEKSFSYEKHVETLSRLIDTISALFTEQDKQFLMSFFSAEPQWNMLEIENLKNLPAIKWKLKNLEELRRNNIKKFENQLKELEHYLSA